jgi:DNA-binding CsgD family transcriptional regulator
LRAARHTTVHADITVAIRVGYRPALVTGDMEGGPEDLVARARELFADDRLDEARATLEQAFVALRDRGDVRAGARVAASLADLHGGPLTNEAMARGWIGRGRRLLEETGPCVEWGYLELARVACERPDIDDLESSAARALEIARQFGDVGLEVRALADSGLALVTQGRVNDGFALLDEAVATVSSGEVDDPQAVALALCSVLSSCDRAGDVERAAETIKVVESLLLQPLDGRPKVIGTHCRLVLGSVLCATGRWDEGEAALLAAIAPEGSVSARHSVEATARLAELRVHQDRIDDAADLLATVEDAVAAAGPLAMVHLRRGDPDLAAAVLRNTIKRMVGDVLRAGPLVALMVEAELARGAVDGARQAALLLRSMAAAVDTPVIAALAGAADGRIALATGDADQAVASFDTALEHVTGGQHPLLAATIRLDLAEAQTAAGDDSAAIASARAVHAAAQRLSAITLGNRAAAMLRRLGATPPRPAPATDALAGLTARELEVLAGIQRGESNAEIAGRLYLSPKTVEHHVGRILAKLGARTRAEAAAVAAHAGV